MKEKKIAILFLLAAWVLSGCASQPSVQSTPAATPAKANTGMPNPASAYCVEKGFRLELQTAPDGSQSGICIFPGGSQCEEWAFYRGECGPDSSLTPSPQVNPTTENKAVEAAKAWLVKEKGVDINSIRLTSLEQVTWPNDCIGLPKENEDCAPIETPGFRMVLTAGQVHYTLHTDLTGSNIREE
ncbi:MAG: DUF333 domain-containing protein [Omnitrophica WOR_2 bacterium]